MSDVINAESASDEFIIKLDPNGEAVDIETPVTVETEQDVLIDAETPDQSSEQPPPGPQQPPEQPQRSSGPQQPAQPPVEEQTEQIEEPQTEEPEPADDDEQIAELERETPPPALNEGEVKEDNFTLTYVKVDSIILDSVTTAYETAAAQIVKASLFAGVPSVLIALLVLALKILSFARKTRLKRAEESSRQFF
ncbi:MAG: hypothetical protein LBL35_05655 [Clostridiales bacterium]|jgi:hypothetical protein|nr:hypothetical protein [Clostridiales bacterium]